MTQYREFQAKVRCGHNTYTESIYTIDREHAWGHATEIEMRYQTWYGYKARVTAVKEVK